MIGNKIASEVLVLERELEVVIEQDEDGLYIASIPVLNGCHTHAKTLNELKDRMIEAAVLYLCSLSGGLKCNVGYKKE
jgi:predicted RNase H-like HicB family nuclease